MTNKYRADLRINKFKLDDEILEQPQKYYEWSQAAMEAMVERDDAKDHYDLILIDVENDIRTNPEDYFEGDSNITEGAIKSALNSHKDVKRARRRFQKARNKYNLLKKAELAFEQRKKMLEAYLYMYNKNVNSDVRLPKQYEKEVAERTSNDVKNDLKRSFSSLPRRKGGR